MSKIKTISIVIAYTGLLLLLLAISFSVVDEYHQKINNQIVTTAASQSSSPPLTISDNIPVFITIENKVHTPVSSEFYNEGSWSISATSASHLSNSAKPGETGNIIMYGHNKKSILGNLAQLTGAEPIVITTRDGAEHRYTIQEMKTIQTTETNYLATTDTEVLTIYTCSGPFDQHRLVIRAVPEESNPPTIGNQQKIERYTYLNPIIELAKEIGAQEIYSYSKKS